MEQLTILAPFSDLFKESVRLCRRSTFRLFWVVTIGFVAMYLNFVVLLSVYELSPALTTAIGLLLSLVIYQVFRLALVRSLVEEKGAFESYKFALRKFTSYLSANFFSFFSVVGGLPAVIPAISLYHSYFMIPFILSSEGKNGVDASLRSREHISGFWWESLGRRLSVLFIAVLVYVLVSLPMSISFFSQFWSAISNLFLIYLIYPFIVAFDLSLYRDISKKRPFLRGGPVRKENIFIPYLTSGIGAAIILGLFLYLLIASGPSALASMLIYLLVIFGLFIF